MAARYERDDPYFRGRALDQYSVNAVSSVFRNHSATSFAWKGLSSRSRSRLSNSVISPAVLGLLILFNARTMCSLRRRLEFGIFFIAGPPSRRTDSAKSCNVCPGCRARRTSMVDHRVLAGSSLISTFRMASGWCSPTSPSKVYERSNPRGPSTFISQLSFARDPTIDTRHSPATSLSTCSTPARISLRARESPVFCISIVTAMSLVLYKVTSNYFLSKPVKTSQIAPSQVLFGRFFTNSCWKAGRRGDGNLGEYFSVEPLLRGLVRRKR